MLNVIKIYRDAFCGSRIFFPIRSIYQCAFNRRGLRARRERRDFYRQFIRSKELVFDVGANIGEYAECFTTLGARVIAIEPDPSCWPRLHQLAKVRDVRVVHTALGSYQCKRTFYLAQESQVSTLVADWHPHPDWPKQRRGTIDIDILTLDQLANEYGIPSFVKIDTEGFDDQVLQGMSFRPPALSFEYLLARLDVARRCLRILANDGYVFNYIRGGGTQMAKWVSADRMRQQLEALTGEPYYGDVFARDQSCLG